MAAEFVLRAPAAPIRCEETRKGGRVVDCTGLEMQPARFYDNPENTRTGGISSSSLTSIRTVQKPQNTPKQRSAVVITTALRDSAAALRSRRATAGSSPRRA